MTSAAFTTPRTAMSAGPALFPTVGSPNPMLTSVAPGPTHRATYSTRARFLAPIRSLVRNLRRAFARSSMARLLRSANAAVAGRPEAVWRCIATGRAGEPWRRRIATVYYATETFSDFTLRLQFRILDPAKHNSGVALPARPTLALNATLNARARGE